jgi:hypothetical protein
MKRQPKGVTVGGQFTVRSRDESGLVLVSEDLPVRITATTILNASQATIVAKQLAAVAKTYGGAGSYSEDDIAQDALLSLLVSMRNETIPGLTSRLIAVAVRYSVATARGKSTGTRHEDWAGRREFVIEQQEMEEALGRPLVSTEIDELATTVRNAWPNPKHRPRKGFHQPSPQIVSTSLESVASQAGNIAAPEPPDEEYRRPEILLDRLCGLEISRAEAQRLAWNSLAADWGVPEATHGSVSKTASRSARRFITNHPGGVPEIAHRYLITGVITPAGSALFSPFRASTGNTTALCRKLLCEAFITHRDTADQMWMSASLYAERNNNEVGHI